MRTQACRGSYHSDSAQLWKASAPLSILAITAWSITPLCLLTQSTILDTTDESSSNIPRSNVHSIHKDSRVTSMKYLREGLDRCIRECWQYYRFYSFIYESNAVQHSSLVLLIINESLFCGVEGAFLYWPCTDVPLSVKGRPLDHNCIFWHCMVSSTIWELHQK